MPQSEFFAMVLKVHFPRLRLNNYLVGVVVRHNIISFQDPNYFQKTDR